MKDNIRNERYEKKPEIKNSRGVDEEIVMIILEFMNRGLVWSRPSLKDKWTMTFPDSCALKR